MQQDGRQPQTLVAVLLQITVRRRRQGAGMKHQSSRCFAPDRNTAHGAPACTQLPASHRQQQALTKRGKSSRRTWNSASNSCCTSKLWALQQAPRVATSRKPFRVCR